VDFARLGPVAAPGPTATGCRGIVDLKRRCATPQSLFIRADEVIR
jgi:hypothetical protein